MNTKSKLDLRKYLTNSSAISRTGIFAVCLTVGAGIFAAAGAQAPAKKEAAKSTALVGDVDRGAEQFEATCAECHGPAATAPTLRGVIGRPIGSVESFFGYSEALKAMSSQKWTAEKIDAYIKAPDTFAPGNLMYRDYPDAQMRADVIAFIASLPPPR